MEHYRSLINEMVSHDPTDRLSIEKTSQQLKNCVDYKEIKDNSRIIQVCHKIKLGQGGYGVVLYGTLTHKIGRRKKKFSVAVKRIDVTHSAINEREESALKQLRHPNVIRLFHATSDDSFRYGI